MFCEFLGAEREAQMCQLLISEPNQVQWNPFVSHTPPEPLNVHTVLPGLTNNRFVQNSLVDMMECGVFSLQCTLHQPMLGPSNKTHTTTSAKYFWYLTPL